MLEKRSVIINNLETAYSWGNQNSLTRMLGMDKEYTQLQIMKLHRMFTKGNLDGANYAKPKIKSILDLNQIDDNQIYDPDNDPALYGF